MPLTVDTKTLARLLGLTQRRIGQLAEAGMPKDSPGRYDLEHVLPWFLGQQKRTPADLSVEKARLTRAQADRQELRHAIESGAVIRSEDAAKQWSGHVVAARARLLGMPSKLGPQLVDVKDPATVAETIRREVYAALDELASWKPNK